MLKRLAAALLIGLVAAQAAAAQTDDEVRVLDWNVTVGIQEDAALAIRESQRIAFPQGDYSTGTRTLSIRNFESIEAIGVFEGDMPYTEVETLQDPGTFTWAVEGPLVQIRWLFETASEETRTFVILYTIRGAVEFDEGIANRLLWDAIPPDHQRPIESASVTVIVPSGGSVDRDLAPASYGADAEISVDNTLVTFDIGTIPMGQGARVEVYFRIPDEMAGAHEIELPGGDPNTVIGPAALLVIEVLVFVGLAAAIVLFARSRRRAQLTDQ
ncbi:MAG: DUF2207 domain-containing protein [Chloroflexi bacterium]|nr:DUF2207 domain-containing protein [Chloroflexota bacterium]